MQSMNRTERLYRIDQLISERGVVSRQSLLDELETSLATLKRDLEYLRERLNAPIVWDRDAGGYRFAHGQQTGAQYELPGLWFSDREIHALLTMQHLLANLDPGGILAPHIQPLMARLNALLGTAEDTAEEVRKRVLIVGIGKRAMKLDHFEHIGSALLRRKRLTIRYYARGTDEETEREVSPQRLVHYRENWYLDAWCHLRRDVRNFAVDSIRHVRLLERPAKEVSGKTLDTVLGPGYGIFTGKRIRRATLRFTPERARWVATEHWHPDQRGTLAPDGRYTLEFPYADHRELIMDILKHGRHCEVLGPASLQEAVTTELHAALTRYPPTSSG
jgi:predicted DNA-binding transcriptional regulator YafY